LALDATHVRAIHRLVAVAAAEGVLVDAGRAVEAALMSNLE
jgi:hypothetical protein